MARRAGNAHPQQLDMFSEAVVEASQENGVEVPVVVDDLPRLLVEKGFVHNEFLLDLNRSVFVHPDADRYPSRLFQFPVEFVRGGRVPEGQSLLWLQSPAFEEQPWCDEIERAIGCRPVWSPVDEFGRDRTQGAFWHAMDLMTDEHVSAFMETKHLSNERMVLNSLAYHMDYGGLSIANARMILSEYGVPEPEDNSEAFLKSSSTYVTRSQQGIYVGFRRNGADAVWAAIHGLEQKRFKRERSGSLRFSKAFLAEKEVAA